jgi:dGTPase
MNNLKLQTVQHSLQAPSKLSTRANNNKAYNPRYRNNFMRDRDRILYSKAFRRLSGKTQVYFIQSNDHLRTRLTHTLEVAQIAKTISSALKLNIDLTEAIALGHDIGHTPFGHAGERVLHEIMTPHINNQNSKNYIEKSPMDSEKISNTLINASGFKHNLQSVRVATTLENLYDSYGMNLTNFTLYGLMNHSKIIYDKYDPKDNFLNFYNESNKLCKLNENNNAWSFESFVVREADEIAQRHHDLEDAIRGNLIIKKEVLELIKSNFYHHMSNNDKKNFKVLNDIKDDKNYFLNQLSKTMVNFLVSRLVKISTINLNIIIEKYKLNQNKFSEFILRSDNLIEDYMYQTISYDLLGETVFTPDYEKFSREISIRTISSYDIQRMDAKGKYILRKLFEAFYCNPQQLPDNSVMAFLRYNEGILGNADDLRKIKNVNNGIGYIRHSFNNLIRNFSDNQSISLMRVICDHLSGMTDNYAIETYDKLYGNSI